MRLVLRPRTTGTVGTSFISRAFKSKERLAAKPEVRPVHFPQQSPVLMIFSPSQRHFEVYQETTRHVTYEGRTGFSDDSKQTDSTAVSVPEPQALRFHNEF